MSMMARSAVGFIDPAFARGYCWGALAARGGGLADGSVPDGQPAARYGIPGRRFLGYTLLEGPGGIVLDDASFKRRGRTDGFT
jgi:hypothetical protein